MPQIQIPANNRGLISTFGQYYNRSSNTFSGIFGTATYPQRALSDLNINYYSSGLYLFWINIATSNSTKGSVSITSPWSETSSGTSTIGNDRQVYSGVYGNISITCNVTYGYTFNGWYTLASGGTSIAPGLEQTIGPNHPYINSVWYAQFL
jgi:hypothetical protein